MTNRTPGCKILLIAAAFLLGTLGPVHAQGTPSANRRGGQLGLGTGVAPQVEGKHGEVCVENFGAVGDGVTDDSGAIQRAVLASVGISNLNQEPVQTVFTVLLRGNYRVSTIYLPRFTRIRGLIPDSGQRSGSRFTSSSNAPILVLGRSLAEQGWLDIDLRDFGIYGDPSKPDQVAIQGAWKGPGGNAYPLHFENIKIRDIGGDGIRLFNNHPTSQLLYTHWTDLDVINCGRYGVHINVGVFNMAQIESCKFLYNRFGGFLVEPSAPTSTAQEIHFINCSFEGNGFNIKDKICKQGSFGFRSNFYQGMYRFDSCYFENNGSAPSDGTGANIDVRTPVSLVIRDSTLVTSNNLIIMRAGGHGVVSDCYLYSALNTRAYFQLSGPPPGTATSSLRLGHNQIASRPTAGNWVVKAGGSRTTVTDPDHETNPLQ